MYKEISKFLENIQMRPHININKKDLTQINVNIDTDLSSTQSL